MIHNIVNALLNVIFVCLPEEAVWLVATLITLKRFDLLDKYMWKQNIKWLSIPIFSTSIIIGLFKYIIIVPRIFMTFSAILTIYLSIIYILKIPENNILNEKIPYLKTLFYVLINFVVLVILVESLYYPILLSFIKESINQINDVWYMNILLSLPGKVIQYFIIIFILFIQNQKTYIEIMKSIFSERKISIVIMIFTSILILFWIMLIDIFGNYKILSLFKIYQQIMLNILLLIVPSILLILMTYLIILFVEKVNKLEMSHRNMFNDIYDDDID